MNVDTTEIDRLAVRLKGLAFMLARPAGIMRTVAQGVEHQTRRRIFFEKRAPDGRPWRPWSASYARTRGAGHSLLIDTRAMVDGLDSSSTAREATIFSRRPYAGRNQRTRPFLGLSAENVRDVEQWLAPALEDLFREAMR